MDLHPQPSCLNSRIGRRDGQRLLCVAGGDDRNTYQWPIPGHGARQQIAPGFHLLPDEGQLTRYQIRDILALVIVPARALEEKSNEIRLYIARNIFHALLGRFLEELVRCLRLTFFFKQRGMLAQNDPPLPLDRGRFSRG
jgi:hypothetical protein